MINHIFTALGAMATCCEIYWACDIYKMGKEAGRKDYWPYVITELILAAASFALTVSLWYAK